MTTIQSGRPSPVPDAYYTAIGKVASSSAMLETLIDSVLWRLSGSEDQVVACLTAQMSGHAPRLRALRSILIVRLGNDDLGKSIEAFKVKVDRLAEKRNRIIHDPLMITNRDDGGETFSRFQVSAHPKPVFAALQTSLEDVNKVADELCDLTGEFDTLIRTHVKPRFPPSPATPI